MVTLIVAPFLLITAIYAYRGSKRSLLICMGLLAYILYTYTGAAFAYSFNKLVLVYIALFSVTIFTLVGVITQVKRPERRRAHHDGSL